MSHISTAFRVLMPAPLATHKFIIVWPNILAERVMLVAEATTFPAIKLGDVAIPFHGETVYRPTGHVNCDHVWRVRVGEDLLMTVRECIYSMHAKPYRSSYSFEGRVNSVSVYIPNQQDVPLPAFTLRGVWLLGREAVDIDSTDPTRPWKWNLEFRYASIEDASLKAVSLIKKNTLIE
jgi:hypothetical protein